MVLWSFAILLWFEIVCHGGMKQGECSGREGEGSAPEGDGG